jgi:hypothetical protein
MGFVFFGIGLTVLGFLWFGPLCEMGWLPPFFQSFLMFFRLFGSFVAITFVPVGGSIAWSSLSAKANPLVPPDVRAAVQARLAQASSAPTAGSYICPHCAAPLTDKADVSQLGDVKCPFCKTWFNINQRRPG